MLATFDNPAAFAPMFDDRVVVRASRRNGETVRGTFAACVFPAESDDPLADVNDSSARRRVSVEIPRTGPGGWNRQDLPQVGDGIEHDGVRYSVAAVSLAVGGNYILINARS